MRHRLDGREDLEQLTPVRLLLLLEGDLLPDVLGQAWLGLELGLWLGLGLGLGLGSGLMPEGEELQAARPPP